MESRKEYTVQSVVTAFNVIEALKEMDGARASELANHLGLPKSTAYNYLSTLVQEDCIVRKGDSYEVGLRFLEYGSYAKKRIDIYEVVKSKTDELAHSTGELASFMIKNQTHGQYLYHARGRRAISPKYIAGARVQLGTTALSKAILAHLSPREKDEYIDKNVINHGDGSCTANRDGLVEEMVEIRKEGVAFDDEKQQAGLRCVAAPVLDRDNRILGSISISGPTRRIQKERFTQNFPKKVQGVATEISLSVPS